MDERLQQVRDFAAKAHGVQKRKYGNDLYIVHPERVMKTCSTYSSEVIMLSAALLHDVLEDTDTSAEMMLQFLSGIFSDDTATAILALVQELTDIYTADAWPQWSRKVRKTKELERLKKISAMAQTIKYADILDNSSEIVANDPEFAGRLLSEYKNVLDGLDKGNPVLRERARMQVLQALDSVLQSHGK